MTRRSNAFPSTSTTKTAPTAARTSPTGRSTGSATHYDDPTIAKWDIFHYVYGVLHHPGYRAKFADNLKRELPRIPFMDDFRAFADAGQRLADLHVGYEQLEPWPLDWVENPGVPISYRVEKMRLSKDKTDARGQRVADAGRASRPRSSATAWATAAPWIG